MRQSPISVAPREGDNRSAAEKNDAACTCGKEQQADESSFNRSEAFEALYCGDMTGRGINGICGLN